MHCKSIAIFVFSCMTALVAAAPTPFLDPALAAVQVAARDPEVLSNIAVAREPEAEPEAEIDERGCSARMGMCI